MMNLDVGCVLRDVKGGGMLDWAKSMHRMS